MGTTLRRGPPSGPGSVKGRTRVAETKTPPRVRSTGRTKAALAIPTRPQAASAGPQSRGEGLGRLSRGGRPGLGIQSRQEPRPLPAPDRRRRTRPEAELLAARRRDPPSQSHSCTPPATPPSRPQPSLPPAPARPPGPHSARPLSRELGPPLPRPVQPRPAPSAPGAHSLALVTPTPCTPPRPVHPNSQMPRRLPAPTGPAPAAAAPRWGPTW